MLKEKEIASVEAGTKRQKFYASRDAEIKNYANSTHYSDAEKLAIDRIKSGLELCYYGTKMYTSFRKKFATIKIEGADVKNQRNLKILEEDYAERGITKVVSAQGVIYRIPKV